MKTLSGSLGWVLAVVLLVTSLELDAAGASSPRGGRSYSSGSRSSGSSGGGSSYSAGRSSSGSSFSSGSKSYSSGGAGSPSGGSRSSGSGSSFSSGGKSYSSGSGSSPASGSSSGAGGTSPGSGSYSSKRSDSSTGTGAHLFSPAPKSDRGSSALAFDGEAARARKQETSRTSYSRYKDAQRAVTEVGSSTYKGPPPPVIRSYSNGYRHTTVYVPDTHIIVTRPYRVQTVFTSYYSRPVIYYHDPYSSLFWWWLLDRSLEDQAYWAYHHRYEMDPARYQALLARDQQLEARVGQLEAQQIARDPSYSPTGLDRDLMYSDNYVNHAYQAQPTDAGRVAFWSLGVPSALAVSGVFTWLIWFKRW